MCTQLQAGKVYNIFFQDNNKLHIVAKFIQFVQKFSTIKITDFNPNHVAMMYIGANGNTIFETNGSGTRHISLDELQKNFKGEIRVYDTLIKSTLLDIDKECTRLATKHYNILGAMSSLEFSYKSKSLKNIFINIFIFLCNSIVDFFGLFSSDNFCSSLVAKLNYALDKNCKTKYMNEIINKFLAQDIIMYQEITPIDLYCIAQKTCKLVQMYKI